MAYTKTIVCLANSRKHSGRCIAGREYSGKGFGGWVRPVSSRQDQEISEEDRRYENGTRAGMLDVIAIPMLEPQPKDYQQENHLIDEKRYWVKCGKLGWNDLCDAVDKNDSPLWIDAGSTYYGLRDKIPLPDAEKLKSSLALIEPIDLKICVALEGGVYGPAKRKVRASFKLTDTEYRLAVTDPVIEETYLKQGLGTYNIDEALLCISLGEPYHGDAYKLVAAVITPN